MVHISPSLRMRRSSILQELFKSFQQPHTLNKRETSELLSLLTTSFRQQLDEPPQQDNKIPRPPFIRPSIIDSKPRRPTFSERIPATEGHFQSILNNALFTGPESTKGTSLNERIRAFEFAFSKGLMTLDKCHKYLEAEDVFISRSKKSTRREGRRESGAGTRVLKWLKASGFWEGGQFLEPIGHKSLGLSGKLAEFVVAEDNSTAKNVLWSQVNRLYSASDFDIPKVSKLVFCIVRAELLNGPDDLNGSVSALIRAYTIAQKCPHDRASFLTLGPSTRLLSHHSTVESQVHPKLTLDNFGALRDIIPKVLRMDHIHTAHLDLHHPTNPSQAAALNMFESMITPSNHEYYTMPSRSSKVINLGLDTAKQLLELGQVTKAKKVINFLQDLFPEELGSKAPEPRNSVSEAHNIGLLDNLSLA